MDIIGNKLHKRETPHFAEYAGQEMADHSKTYLIPDLDHSITIDLQYDDKRKPFFSRLKRLLYGKSKKIPISVEEVVSSPFSTLGKISQWLVVSFTTLIVLFLILNKLNHSKISIPSFLPIGSIGREARWNDLAAAKDSAAHSDVHNHTEEDEDHTEEEDDQLDEEYYQDEDDRDFWIDDGDEPHPEVKITEKEEQKNHANFTGGEGELNYYYLNNEQLFIPEDLTIYGRVGEFSNLVNGNYIIMMNNANIDMSDHAIPKVDSKPHIVGGRVVYKKSTNGLETFLWFDSVHHFWVLGDKLEQEPLAFLPDHSLFPIKHSGPYGAHPNSAWYFREKNGIIKDRIVRAIDGSPRRVIVHVSEDKAREHRNQILSASKKNHGHHYDEKHVHQRKYPDPYKNYK